LDKFHKIHLTEGSKIRTLLRIESGGLRRSSQYERDLC